MRIAFVHNRKAFLPEIAAYTRYFNKSGIQCQVVGPGHNTKADVEWHFMGTHRTKKKPGVFTLHEYTSASMPPLRKWKDDFKRIFNVKPDYRLFLNEYVQQAFSFDDGVPYGLRDMGVNKDWLQPMEVKKEYDLIYVGEIRPGLLEILEKFKDRSVLVVSNKSEKFGNIHFIGPVPHDEVRELICKSRYGLNFMPDVEPFNRQTSTKLLEYCACRVPVITSDYHWARSFETRSGARFFFLKDEINWNEINSFDYKFPDLLEWTWEKQIENSGIVEVLQNLR